MLWHLEAIKAGVLSSPGLCYIGIPSLKAVTQLQEHYCKQRHTTKHELTLQMNLQRGGCILWVSLPEFSIVCWVSPPVILPVKGRTSWPWLLQICRLTHLDNVISPHWHLLPHAEIWDKVYSCVHFSFFWWLIHLRGRFRGRSDRWTRDKSKHA